MKKTQGAHSFSFFIFLLTDNVNSGLRAFEISRPNLLKDKLGLEISKSHYPEISLTITIQFLKEVRINIEGVSLVEFFGVKNSKFKMMQRSFPRLKLTARGSRISGVGSQKDLEQFEELSNQIMEFLRRYGQLSTNNLEAMLAGLEPTEIPTPEVDKDLILYGRNGRPIKARTHNQKQIVELLKTNDILFAVGPAGTGKTYTAVAMAVQALKSRKVKRIILTRPAVEAGESLGFLPGDLKDKIDPYLRPLYDALDDMIPPDKLRQYMENRIVEIAPLAYMRGRTLNDAFIIMDEAQNSTAVQLKMLLTRIGPTASCVITGDVTQVDLPRNQKSGLVHTLKVLEHIEGIAVVRMSPEDVLRHKLVKKIIIAFDKDYEIKKKAKEEARANGSARHSSRDDY